MKELSIEEKAKAYDKALKKANNELKACGTFDCEGAKQIFRLFPELKESDDERIRKEIIDIIDSYDVYHLKAAGLPSRIPEYIAWLEKQGEQKPADKVEPKFNIGDKIISIISGIQYYITKVCDNYYYTESGCIIMFCAQNNFELVEQKPAWSEEDEITKNNISHIIRQYDKISKRENQPCWYVGDCLLWMQNIKDRVQPQQEWSEEDEKMLNVVIKSCEQCGNEYAYYWIKSLKDRYTWKPSDEQMEALWSATEKYLESDNENVRKLRGEVLESLYEDLKKLKEE